MRIENLRVRDFLKSDSALGSRPDLILIDPPRSGVKRSSLDRIISMSSARINYVSCNPSTLARDLRIMMDGGYAIDSLGVLDLFPQTHHVETVARLKRSE